MPETENKSCCRIEYGALTYGIFNIVVAGLGSIVGIGFLIYFATHNNNDSLEFALMILTWICTVPCLLVLVFSIVLVCGISKKIPGPVLAHFIFGIIFAIATMTLSLGSLIIVGDYSQEAVIAFFVILIYSLPLIVVYLTFRKFSDRTAYQICNKAENTCKEWSSTQAIP